MKTAEEFLIEDNTGDDNYSICQVMIEFAKMHVEAALKVANNNALVIDDRYDQAYVDSDSILNAYPLTNIK